MRKLVNSGRNVSRLIVKSTNKNRLLIMCSVEV